MATVFLFFSQSKDVYASIGLEEDTVRLCQTLAAATAFKADELLSVLDQSWEGFTVRKHEYIAALNCMIDDQ